MFFSYILYLWRWYNFRWSHFSSTNSSPSTLLRKSWLQTANATFWLTLWSLSYQIFSEVRPSAAIVLILLYGWTSWTQTKRLEKKLDGNYTRMLRAILNKSWRQHPTKQQLYGHLPPITKIIKVRRTRHARQCTRSRERAHKWCTHMDPFIWPGKKMVTSSNQHTAALWGYRV